MLPAQAAAHRVLQIFLTEILDRGSTDFLPLSFSLLLPVWLCPVQELLGGASQVDFAKFNEMFNAAVSFVEAAKGKHFKTPPLLSWFDTASICATSLTHHFLSLSITNGLAHCTTIFASPALCGV